MAILKSTTVEPIIKCENLSKWYGQVIALNNVSLSIDQGIVGLLGPNGAGKTTFLDLVVGRLRPSRGTITVLGEDPWSSPTLFRYLGYCPDTDGLYERLSGLDFVTLLARLTGFPSAEAKKRAMDRLELVGLAGHAHRPAGTYSKGMKQRLKLAAALVHDPKLLILDEPLNGLDPIARIEVTQLLRTLGAEGISIILSSHILAEVEALTSRIVLIHYGKILAEGEIGEIRALIDNQPYTYRIGTSAARRLAAALVENPTVESVSFGNEGNTLTVKTTDALQLCNAVQQLVVEEGLTVTSIAPVDDSLEAVFQYLVKD